MSGGDGRWLVPRTGRTLAAWLRFLMRAPRSAASSLAPLWPLSGTLALWTGGLLVLGVATAYFADAWAVERGRALPSWMHAVFGEVTNFGMTALFLDPLAIALVILAAIDWTRLRPFARGVAAAFIVRLGFLFFAIGAGALFTGIVKHVVGRARPFVTGEADASAYMPLSLNDAYASFPSGHATTAFAAAVALASLWPRARPFLLAYALLIAGSRVALGAHHPSDVMAGAVVGTLAALVVRSWFAARHLAFTVNAQGTVVRRPGPSWRRLKALARAVLRF